MGRCALSAAQWRGVDPEELRAVRTRAGYVGEVELESEVVGRGRSERR